MERFLAVQEELRKKVSLRDGFLGPRRVAGVDVAYVGRRAFTAAVVLDYETQEVLEERVVEGEATLPYVPTFLAFREAPLVTEAVKDLSFDVLILDGQGIAHPRGVGIASHVGVLLDAATIGVAKRLLCGEVAGEVRVGSPASIVYHGAEVGYAFKAREGVKPIYISPGHRVSLLSALRIVQGCTRGHRLPEPTRRAHILATAARRKVK